MTAVRGAALGALLAATLAGYAASQTNPAAPLAVEALPQHHVGDSLTYDNNGVERTVTVSAVSGDEITWTDKAGSKWVGFRDPSIPPRSETPANGGTSLTRSFEPEMPTVFPLVADKEVAYKVIVRQGDGPPRVERDSCQVRRSHKLTVEAGTFTAWEIACQRGDGLETLFYAPEVGAVLERDFQSGGTLRRMTLANYHKFGEVLPSLAMVDTGEDKDTADQPAAGGAAPATGAKPAPPPRPPAEPTTPVTAKALPAPAAQAPASKPAAAARAEPPAVRPEPPLPVQRPARAATAAAAKPAPPAKAAPATQLASLPKKSAAATGPVASPTGKFLVQFVAFGAPAEASRNWDALRARLPALLARLKPRYDTVTTVGGMTLARLSLGPFASEAEAKELCTTLHTAGPECWVRPLK